MLGDILDRSVRRTFDPGERPEPREAALSAATRSTSALSVDAHAEDSDLRAWLDALPTRPGARAVAFDTRMTGPALFTGRASRGIARQLRRHGAWLVDEPTSFLVDHSNHLCAGEREPRGRLGPDVG